MLWRETKTGICIRDKVLYPPFDGSGSHPSSLPFLPYVLYRCKSWSVDPYLRSPFGLPSSGLLDDGTGAYSYDSSNAQQAETRRLDEIQEEEQLGEVTHSIPPPLFPSNAVHRMRLRLIG